MRIQLLSDLHLESEAFDPQPAPGADLLVLAGDIDSTWLGYERFAGWPVPVVVVAGNHEFDGRDLETAWPALRERCAAFGLTLVERETWRWTAPDGTRLRLLATVRWSDFDVFGPKERERCVRAATYFANVMRARRHGALFDAPAVRREALACRRWLAHTLAEPPQPGERTVVVTHFAPSLRSLDPRYGMQPSTASFCNADDALMPGVDLWIHGHVHRRFDYLVAHADAAPTRVVSNARGIGVKGECEDFDGQRLIDLA
ncbi:metallophosphoesterase [Azohydromonas sediminis]|uniref:metallophosphoesterase n=1 Tax=Azohydromonas sediminis TaxID=2259674 RepID=UPI000E645EC5|nr:metallophosphoesterase [Azohydromonas sediminis]